MQAHLSAKAVREDPLAFTLHINLCAVHMFLHEAAIGKVTEQDLPQLVAAESRKCSTAAAFKVLSAVRMNWPAQHSQVSNAPRHLWLWRGVVTGTDILFGLSSA